MWNKCPTQPSKRNKLTQKWLKNYACIYLNLHIILFPFLKVFFVRYPGRPSRQSRLLNMWIGFPCTKLWYHMHAFFYPTTEKVSPLLGGNVFKINISGVVEKAEGLNREIRSRTLFLRFLWWSGFGAGSNWLIFMRREISVLSGKKWFGNLNLKEYEKIFKFQTGILCKQLFWKSVFELK